jgi:hypothetical protein
VAVIIIIDDKTNDDRYFFAGCFAGIEGFKETLIQMEVNVLGATNKCCSSARDTGDEAILPLW